MNIFSSPGFQHLIAGLAVIGAVAALAATGTVSGSEALAAILSVGGFLLGGTLSTSSATQASGAAIKAAAIPTVESPVAPVQ